MTSACDNFAIPTGLRHSAQGWLAERLPLVRRTKMASTLKGLRHFISRVWLSIDATLSGLLPLFDITQGSSQPRNPGLSDGIPLGFKVGIPKTNNRPKVRCSLFAIRHLPSWT